ncbi:hypothetical protein EV182_008798, partial [Spiromyces aspiralis]
ATDTEAATNTKAININPTTMGTMGTGQQAVVTGATIAPLRAEAVGATIAVDIGPGTLTAAVAPMVVGIAAAATTGPGTMRAAEAATTITAVPATAMAGVVVAGED